MIEAEKEAAGELDVSTVDRIKIFANSSMARIRESNAMLSESERAAVRNLATMAPADYAAAWAKINHLKG